jgi:hypothetical protein
MSLHRKNLLEAFRKSDASSAPPSPPAPAQPTLFEVSGAAPPARRRDAVWALAVVGLVAAFVLGFVVGRNTRSETRAEERAPAAGAGGSRPVQQPRAFQDRPPASPALAIPAAPAPAPATGRIEDSPLFDPANLYTVVVASYTRSNQDLAWATHEHLRDAKLPVFPPVESRNLVVVLAGAAPTSGELEEVEEAVKALSRDGRKKDYSDAYRARIDPLIGPRPKKGSKP